MDEYNKTDNAYFNYQCSTVNVYNYTLANISLILSFIFVLGLLILICAYIASCICRKRERNGYDTIN